MANIGSDNDLALLSKKPLPEPALTYHRHKPIVGNNELTNLLTLI